MAAVIFRCSHQQKALPVACSGIQQCSFSTENPNRMKYQSLPSLKKGTGGRSSFNGVVATVFGNSGFVGKYVCNRLGKIGTQLILPYRGDSYEVRPLRLVGDLGQVLFQPFNLRDEDSIYKSVQYSNVVINLIGRDWETKNFSFKDVHVEGARTLARIAKQANVDTFIHMSALNAAERPEAFMIKGGSKFLASKWEGENAVREEFPDAIIVKPSDIYGQEDRFLSYFCNNIRHTARWIALYKKGECTEKQPVYVGDVAAGIAALCKERRNHVGDIIQAVGPRRYLLSDLVDWFHRINRRVEGYGYYRYDMRFDPFFYLRTSILPKLSLGRPLGNLHWERVETEIHSDKIDKKLKTLEDLGVNLTLMENQVPWELKPFKAHAYYDEGLGEFETPAPPPTLAI